MDDNNNLYMPNGITHKKEYIKGMGREEFTALFKIAIVSLIISIIIYMVKNIMIYSLLFFLITIIFSYLLLMKNEYNLSSVIWVKQMIKFLKGQKIYKYKYQDEWRKEQ